MAYVYSGNNYRGGATGIERDFDLRDYYAKLAAESIAGGQGYATEEQIERSRNDLQDPLNKFKDMSEKGMYSDNDITSILSAKTQAITNTANAMQQNLNTQISQRGLSANAGANAALGLTSQFKAAGERGQAYGDIKRDQAQSKLTGLQGYGAMSGQMADYASRPTRMNVDDEAYGKMYDKWRNKQVGYDGAKWGNKPAQPDFY